jgi:tRNA(Ile)-lysidine synthase
MPASLRLPDPPPARRYWLAFSGGLDSTVLLHLLAARGLPLTAIHVHHGLQAQADAWAAHCQTVCDALGVPLELIRVQVQPTGEGPEAAARAVRYQALAARLSAGEILITAHHRDDQAETVLLRLLRGSGVRGLAAMAPLGRFAAGQLWRPLLAERRALLAAWAAEQGIYGLHDPHNEDPRYARSWLRQQLMPLLRQRYPQADEALARAADQARDAQAALTELAELDGAQARAREDFGPALRISRLLALSPARRYNLLRHWLDQSGFAPPDAAFWPRLDAEVLGARVDGEPCLRLGAYEFRRYRDALYLMAVLPSPPAQSCLWQGGTELALPPGCGRLQARVAPSLSLEVGFARGGERIRVGGRRRTLKQLAQQAGIPPWVRVRLPLLYHGAQLIGVADRWADDAYAAAARDWGLHWQAPWQLPQPERGTLR